MEEMKKMYSFIDRTDTENPVIKEFDTRKEMFSYIHSLYGRFNRFRSIEDIFNRFAMNPNDTYFNVEYSGYMAISHNYALRPFMAFEDGRAFDIREYKEEIQNTPDNLWWHGSPRRRKWDLEGYQSMSYYRVPHVKHYIRASKDPEYGQWIRGNKTKYWWDYADTYCCRITRSWKDQCKSRKQWARHSKATIGRCGKLAMEYIEDEEYLES